MSDLKLLIKIPSRERPQKFFDVLNKAQANRELTTTRFMITLDENDRQMNNVHSIKTLGMWGNLTYHFGESDNKVHAINRDMEKAPDFDVLLLLSDDMHVQVKGFDRIILEHFEKHFPDTDGVLWMNDGHCGKGSKHQLNTIVCIGKKYYERFGFLYDPAYKSLFCDQEFMDISIALQKSFYIDDVLIQHRHPMNVKGVQSDNLYRRNDALYFIDKRTYEMRKKQLKAA